MASKHLHFFQTALIVVVLTGANAEKQKPLGHFLVLAKSGLNMRAEPSITSRVVGALPYGWIGPVLKRSNKEHQIQGAKGIWLLTEYDNRSGWVFSGFVTVGPDAWSLKDKIPSSILKAEVFSNHSVLPGSPQPDRVLRFLNPFDGRALYTCFIFPHHAVVSFESGRIQVQPLDAGKDERTNCNPKRKNFIAKVGWLLYFGDNYLAYEEGTDAVLRGLSFYDWRNNRKVASHGYIATYYARGSERLVSFQDGGVRFFDWEKPSCDLCNDDSRECVNSMKKSVGLAQSAALDCTRACAQLKAGYGHEQFVTLIRAHRWTPGEKRPAPLSEVRCVLL